MWLFEKPLKSSLSYPLSSHVQWLITKLSLPSSNYCLLNCSITHAKDAPSMPLSKRKGSVFFLCLLIFNGLPRFFFKAHRRRRRRWRFWVGLPPIITNKAMAPKLDHKIVFSRRNNVGLNTRRREVLVTENPVALSICRRALRHWRSTKRSFGMVGSRRWTDN